MPLNALPEDEEEGEDGLLGEGKENVQGKKEGVNVRDFNQRLCTVLDRVYQRVLSEDRRVR